MLIWYGRAILLHSGVLGEGIYWVGYADYGLLIYLVSIYIGRW